jgi:hypothetical protein
MHKKFLWKVAIVCCCLILHQSRVATAANQTKVWIGAGLIGGGVALTVHGGQHVLCFGTDCGNSSDIEIITGLGMVGVGTFFLIKGLRQDKSKLSEKSNATGRRVYISVGPVKKGWAGALMIHW